LYVIYFDVFGMRIYLAGLELLKQLLELSFLILTGWGIKWCLGTFVNLWQVIILLWMS